MTDTDNPIEPRRGLEHVYPLREHFTARLILPRDLTMAEVERITKMLEVLVVPGVRND